MQKATSEDNPSIHDFIELKFSKNEIGKIVNFKNLQTISG